MDKNSRYYNLIEKLVQNHRKYPGYEAILDEIVEDVYSHAESVINSINDESVIQGYLQKVVSTSIITVPKRLNFHSELKHKIITTDTVVRDVIAPSEPVAIEEPTVSVSEPKEFVSLEEELSKEDDLVDEIGAATEVYENDDAQIEPVEISEFSESDSETQDMFTLEEDLTAEDNSSDEYDTAVEVQQESLEENTLEISDEIVQKADPELVDKMINSIATESVAESELSNLQEEVDETFELVDDADEIELTETVNEDTSEEDDETIVTEELPIVETDNDVELQEADVLDISEEPITSDNEGEQTELSYSSEVEIETFETADDIGLEQDSDEILLQEDVVEYTPNNLELTDTESDSTTLSEDFSQDVSEIETSEEDFTEVSDGDILVNEDQETELLVGESEDFAITELNDTEETALEETEPVGSIEEDISEFDGPVETLEQDINFAADEFMNIEPDDNLEESLDEVEETLSELSGDDIGLNFSADSEEMLPESSDSDVLKLDLPMPEISMEDEKPQSEGVEFKPVDYSAFDYAPENIENDFDENDLEKELLSLNNSMPELNILKVFELKYKKNMSVSNIAEELNTDKQNVIAALDELIKLV